MDVSDVIKYVATFLNLSDLLETRDLGGDLRPTDEQTIELNTLVSCCNLVINQVASEYITLKAKKIMNTSSGIIYYSDMTNRVIVDVLKVRKNNSEVEFVCRPSYLETIPGIVEVEYAYQPSTVRSTSDRIDFNKFKLNERVLAYGVAAEYCFINSNYDDAAIWDNRFKKSLTNINRSRREIKIKERLWI